MFIKKIKISNEEETKELAKKFIPILKKGDCIALYGDLGTGKTSFTRGLIKTIGGDKLEVPSPTFTLVQFYELPEFTLWHFDLYRIKHQEEIYELGWEEACHSGVCLIEWPENAGELLPKDRIEIEIFFDYKENEEETNRIITIKGLGEMEKRLNEADF